MSITGIFDARRYAGRLRRSLRRIDFSPIETVRGWRDIPEINQRFPELRQYAATSRGARQRLSDAHRSYVSQVSNDMMAASLELSVFLDVFCDILKPRRIADLGSGFSSYVLRAWRERAGSPQVEVFSVDDSPEWLERTKDYLREKDLPTDGVLTWADFAASAEEATFDLVLHDLGSMPFRAETLGRVLALVKPTGHVVLDDVHKPTYRRHAARVLRRADLSPLSLRRLTRDDKLRYAWLVPRT